VYTLVDKILQRIIHKAMLGHAGFSGKKRRSNAHPEMGAKTGSVGASVPGVGGAFIDHFELLGLQHIAQALCHLFGKGVGHGSVLQQVK